MVVEHQDPLPVVRVDQIPREAQTHRWLVEQLWGESSVGVIGGAPKCSKTWLGLDLALSVATGTACLGRYAVPRSGPVLVYLAEDALPIVRERVEGMARHRGLDLTGVDIHVITAPDAAIGSRAASSATAGHGPAAAAPVAAVGSARAAARAGRK